MTRYPVQPRDRIFVIKKLCILSFAKNIGKNISNNISKYVNGKQSQKPWSWSCQTICQRCM